MPYRHRAARYTSAGTPAYVERLRAEHPGWEFRIVPAIPPGPRAFVNRRGEFLCVDCGPIDRQHLKPVEPDAVTTCVRCRRTLVFAAWRKLVWQDPTQSEGMGDGVAVA